MQTVLDLPELKDTEKTKDSVKKFDSYVCTDNADESVKNMMSDSPNHEATDIAVKIKSGKKQKRLKVKAKINKIKQNARKDKSEQKDKEEMKNNVNKFDSLDNVDESVKNALSDSSYQETSNVIVKEENGKKRKWLRNEVKNNKTKRGAGKDTPPDVNTENTDTSASSCSQYHALEYLHTWKSARDRWAFQKVRQVWLLQHMYDSTKVSACSSFSLGVF